MTGKCHFFFKQLASALTPDQKTSHEQELGATCLMRKTKKQEELKDDTIRLALANRAIVIARSRIQWVQAQGDYMRLHTGKQSYLARIPLRVLEERWGKYGFLRIHRRHMVFSPWSLTYGKDLLATPYG
jgi:DNA-binding LytR/AlgR family response regulator